MESGLENADTDWPPIPKCNFTCGWLNSLKWNLNPWYFSSGTTLYKECAILITKPCIVALVSELPVQNNNTTIWNNSGKYCCTCNKFSNDIENNIRNITLTLPQIGSSSNLSAVVFEVLFNILENISNFVFRKFKEISYVK